MAEIIRNCENCDLLGSDGDGPEYNGSWPVCNLTYCNSEIENEEDDNTNKPGFPFKTEQPCHVPAFWQYIGLDDELRTMFDKEANETQGEPNGPSFDKTFARFSEKYRREDGAAESCGSVGEHPTTQQWRGACGNCALQARVDVWHAISKPSEIIGGA